MELQDTIDQMDISIKDLHTSFKTYQINQEKKMNQYIAATQRLPLTHEDTSNHHEKSDFINFITKGLNSKGLSSDQRTGEYLIPKMIIEEIQKQASNKNTLRSLAAHTEISTDTYEMLIEQGGASVGWASETEDRNETSLSELIKLSIPTHEIYAKPKTSQKILDDASINVEAWIYNNIAESMGIMENQAFIKGDGIGKPKGILPYVRDNSIESIKSGEKGILKNADVLMQAANALENHYLDNAVWLMSRSALSMIRLLKDNATGQYLLQPSLQTDMNTTLLGFPVIINDALDPVQSGISSTPILFGNFKQAYQIVDRREMTLLRDPYSSKPFVEFYATKRVGGDVVNTNAIKAIQLAE